MNNVPKSIKDLIPYAYSWQEPEFVRSESGQLVYRTAAQSNAGGSRHHVYFPVDPTGRVLYAQEKWDNLEDDATRAVENGKIQFDSLPSSH
mgnify:CR=1 FL=1